ncbi:galactose-3-O-sulfotransferase 3-like isoform X2 [Megalops cyprinoides]|uniref:galactose-3-O-sulfotransferase 3-like isoform X2 n=1 Tax=Megalops cyprinoides TaxID=118141 RepID=UPI001864553F|nr:galactose-3-O-sulfotransferase 3-like isoform X2 [Megalops cyprinoides]
MKPFQVPKFNFQIFNSDCIGLLPACNACQGTCFQGNLSQTVTCVKAKQSPLPVCCPPLSVPGEQWRMSHKKVFIVLLAVSSLSLLLHHGGHFWTMKAFNVTCSVTLPQPSKHTSVGFLKTHKTASSTIQNMLFRFAERHNLTVALPVQACDHQFCYPRPFSGRFVHPHTLPPNIITSHMRFNLSQLRRLMPPDTLYVTILREPAAMFESLFTYYSQHCGSFQRVPNGSLEAFLSNPWQYYRPHEEDSMYARNTLTYDLGGEKDHVPSDTGYMRGFIAEVERVFSLVMIAEHFDESLVLLRSLLSWDLEDVVYLELNMRTPTSKQNLSSELPALIRAWNALDARLYDHFNASLWRRLESLGLDCVAQEVTLLRQARDRVLRGCFGGKPPQVRPATQIKNKEFRPWLPSSKVDIVGYDLPLNASQPGAAAGGTPQDLCLKLIMPEVQYSRQLLRTQSLRYRKNHPFRLKPRPHPPHVPSQTASTPTLPPSTNHTSHSREKSHSTRNPPPQSQQPPTQAPARAVWTPPPPARPKT